MATPSPIHGPSQPEYVPPSTTTVGTQTENEPADATVEIAREFFRRWNSSPI
ncbi:MAG: hypothetical protein SP1CHLAM54_01180 [Chlamydiia bacterium]|nr:hypothetical protein [Chlamydiia bacterium]MCH9615040.1 hypothetical protein [Chlamydiia bacterium]MCH9629909.1 hypothetical protein [Chlamydiia bacterium]